MPENEEIPVSEDSEQEESESVSEGSEEEVGDGVPELPEDPEGEKPVLVQFTEDQSVFFQNMDSQLTLMVEQNEELQKKYDQMLEQNEQLLISYEESPKDYGTMETSLQEIAGHTNFMLMVVLPFVVVFVFLGKVISPFTKF